MTILHFKKSICRSPSRLGVLLIALAWFALSPTARAALPPPAPDGGYPNGNTAEGTNALFSLTTGTQNTANGSGALQNNTSGSFNTANGGGALGNNTTGNENTAEGALALQSNTGGNSNTANGVSALFSNTTGYNNTANGAGALYANTTGHDNTANGLDALVANTIGSQNTASGFEALDSNTTGSNNTATGFHALLVSTGGNDNTGTGVSALYQDTTGHDNTGEGFQALVNDTTGSNNIALGSNAGQNLTTGDYNIDIGNKGVAGEAQTIRIGEREDQERVFIAGIHGSTVANGVEVLVNRDGKLGTILSSARFKEAIKPMDKASEAILALQPVTFRYKHELDPDGIPQFGLVAEQVEKVNPDLVVRDEDGKVNTVRYEAVNAMLLNEFLKEHRKAQAQERKVEEQGATIAQQQKEIATLAAQLKEQAALIRKVSDRLEASKPAAQLVASNQ